MFVNGMFVDRLCSLRFHKRMLVDAVCAVSWSENGVFSNCQDSEVEGEEEDNRFGCKHSGVRGGLVKLVRCVGVGGVCVGVYVGGAWREEGVCVVIKVLPSCFFYSDFFWNV